MIWEEFNLARKLGTIPPHRMKANSEAADRRGKLLGKRRVMRGEWALYCEPALQLPISDKIAVPFG